MKIYSVNFFSYRGFRFQVESKIWYCSMESFTGKFCTSLLHYVTRKFADQPSYCEHIISDLNNQIKKDTSK